MASRAWTCPKLPCPPVSSTSCAVPSPSTAPLWRLIGSSGRSGLPANTTPCSTPCSSAPGSGSGPTRFLPDPAEELPEVLHTPYEEAIRDASRTVGQLFLEAGDIPHAWNYFRLIGEPGPVRDALDAARPGEDEEFYPLVEIALHHRVHPTKGFDLVLERQGICSAITLFQRLRGGPGPGRYEPIAPAGWWRLCTSNSVSGLLAEIRQHDNTEPPADATVSQLIEGRDWLFGEDAYLIDVSHLGAIVQAAMHLPPGDA